MLVVTTFVSLVLALCFVAKVHPLVIAIVFAILCSRVLAIACAQNLKIALPCVAISLAIPVVINWTEIQSACLTPNRRNPLSDWMFWILMYIFPFISALIVDSIIHWDLRIKLYARFAIEALVLTSWVCISHEIYVEMLASKT